MPHLGSMPDPKDKPRTLLVGWISRLDLALELGLSVDTLRRWEAMRTGPPCVRAGRKVYYRRAAVEVRRVESRRQQVNVLPQDRVAGGAEAALLGETVLIARRQAVAHREGARDRIALEHHEIDPQIGARRGKLVERERSPGDVGMDGEKAGASRRFENEV